MEKFNRIGLKKAKGKGCENRVSLVFYYNNQEIRRITVEVSELFPGKLKTPLKVRAVSVWEADCEFFKRRETYRLRQRILQIFLKACENQKEIFWISYESYLEERKVKIDEVLEKAAWFSISRKDSQDSYPGCFFISKYN